VLYQYHAENFTSGWVLALRKNFVPPNSRPVNVFSLSYTHHLIPAYWRWPQLLPTNHLPKGGGRRMDMYWAAFIQQNYLLYPSYLSKISSELQHQGTGMGKIHSINWCTDHQLSPEKWWADHEGEAWSFTHTDYCQLGMPQIGYMCNLGVPSWLAMANGIHH
jgi:hypothetical protein